MAVFVIGNGKSLLQTNLNKLIGEKCYATNHIWKLWKNNRKVKWRPTDYVRCEYPRYNKGDVGIDLREMAYVPCILHLETRLRFSWHPIPTVKTHVEWFEPCDGKEPHDWHLPKICSFGTVVTTAIQIAVLDGADEICLMGCDLENGHFYDNQPTNVELAMKAHLLAARCSPVPIYNCSPGKLSMYPFKERISDAKNQESN